MTETANEAPRGQIWDETLRQWVDPQASQSAAELANDLAFRTRYAPIDGNRVFLPAGALASMQGSPSLSFSGAGGWTAAWLLDAAADEAAGGATFLPSWWQTYDVDVFWLNSGAGAGDVRLSFAFQEAAAGASVNSIASNAGITRTARAQNLLDIAPARVGLAYAGGLITFNIIRDADNVADTLANDIALIGVAFRRVS